MRRSVILPVGPQPDWETQDSSGVEKSELLPLSERLECIERHIVIASHLLLI